MSTCSPRMIELSASVDASHLGLLLLLLLFRALLVRRLFRDYQKLPPPGGQHCITPFIIIFWPTSTKPQAWKLRHYYYYYYKVNRFDPVDSNKVRCMKVCWWHAQHRMRARCAIVKPTATMRVGSRIKRDSCWKRSSGWHGGSVCVIYTTVGRFNWYTASRGSLGDSWLGVSPRPHPQQCRSNVRLCRSNIRLCCHKRQQCRTILL